MDRVQRVEYWHWSVGEIFSVDQIKQLHSVIKDNINNDIKDLPASGVSKTSKVNFISFKSLRPYFSDLEQRIKWCNNEHFGFNLHEFTDFDTVHLNTYNSSNSGEYGWHSDTADGDKPWDIKFTVLINVSQNSYTGGDFQFMLNGEKDVPELNNCGDVVMFRSHLQHRVKPMILGERQTLTLFVIGPKFQ